MFGVLFCLTCLLCSIVCVELRGWRKSLLNVPDSADFDATKPVSWMNPDNTTHIYGYHQEILPEFTGWENRKTWQSAKAICSSYANRPGGCYLIEPDSLEETVTFVMMVEDGLYGRHQWTSFYLEDNDIFSALTNDNVSYPNASYAELPDNEFASNIGLKLGRSDDFLFMPASMIVPMNFFCECEDVCQPGIGACRDPCCVPSHEICTIVDEVTAICSCPPGTSSAHCAHTQNVKYHF